MIRLFSLMLAAVILAFSSAAQSEDILIENARGSKVKVCAYRSDDKSLIRPRECWMIKSRQSVVWKRGTNQSRFDIRVFGPGVFELPICMKRNFGDVFRLRVSPVNSKTCVTASKRTVVQSREWQINDKVLANRKFDDYWYPATILNKSENRYHVRFQSGQTAIVEPSLIVAENFEAGARIECNWKGQGRWYPGSIIWRKDYRVEIRYDDGWSAQDSLANVRVASRDIAKLPQPQVD